MAEMALREAMAEASKQKAEADREKPQEHMGKATVHSMLAVEEAAVARSRQEPHPEAQEEMAAQAVEAGEQHHHMARARIMPVPEQPIPVVVEAVAEAWKGLPTREHLASA